MSRKDLSDAIRRNDLSQAKSLITANPSLIEELVSEPETVRYSPFVEAVIHKRMEIATFLVAAGADIHRRFDATEEKGFTVAHWAALNCGQEILKQLTDMGVMFDVKTSKNTSPLSKSACIENSSALKFFLEVLKFDPHTKSFQGDSLLHIAAYSGRVEPFKYLYHFHHLDLYEENEYHLTPAFKAAAGSVRLMSELVSMGVNYSSMVNTRHNSYNYALWTPLHYACERGNIETFKYMAETLHLDLNARTHFNSNCLLIAAGSSLDLVKLLLVEYKQDPHIVNGFGENPAFIASKHGKVEVVKYLWATTGVDLSLKNRDGLGVLEAIRGKKWEQDIRSVVDSIAATVWRLRKGLLLARIRCQKLKLV